MNKYRRPDFSDTKPWENMVEVKLSKERDRAIVNWVRYSFEEIPDWIKDKVILLLNKWKKWEE